MAKKYDIFISYAGEDREDFVQPLAEKLKTEGLKVWYDKFCLQAGDSIIGKIDEGLLSSKYGVLVLSHNFFNKKWPIKELNALSHLEASGENAILPIWKEISQREVQKNSPMLADRFAIMAYEGIDKVAAHIVKRVDPKNPFPENLLEKEIEESALNSDSEIDIRLEAKANMRVKGIGPYKKSTDYICISVNNFGQRRVYIEKAGLHREVKKGQFLVSSDSYFFGVRNLGDGDRADYMIEQNLVDLDQVDYVWAKDRVGRTWKKDIKLTKKT